MATSCICVSHRGGGGCACTNVSAVTARKSATDGRAASDDDDAARAAIAAPYVAAYEARTGVGDTAPIKAKDTAAKGAATVDV